MNADTLPLSLPDSDDSDAAFVQAALQAPRRSGGAFTERLEADVAEWAGRGHAVAVASGTIGTWLALRAAGIGAGDEVIVGPIGWHQVAHAVLLAGAVPVIADIDYWTGCLDPVRAEARVTPRTRAILAGNVNGHPAQWAGFEALAARHGLLLLEDSTEALGSMYRGRRCGSFGVASVLDLSAPSAVDAGGGALVLTDDAALASELRYLRQRQLEDRHSVSVGSRVPLQATVPETTAALALAQWQRIDAILARRKQVEGWYLDEIRSFEGVKPPYLADGVDAVHWMTFTVHLGTRFTASARRQMVDDLAADGIEAAAFCQPLHRQFAYADAVPSAPAPTSAPAAAAPQASAASAPESAAANASAVPSSAATSRRLPLADRIGDRMLALPLHGAMTQPEVAFIVKTLKDASINVGAGAAIYL